MLRFILAVLIIAVMLRVTQDNPYVGFGLWFFLMLAFMIYTINSVDCEDVELEREILMSPEKRRQYYYMINAQ